MSANPRGPIMQRLVILFLAPLLGALFLFVPRGDGIGIGLIVYGLLLLGLGFYTAAAMAVRPAPRIFIGLGLALGMLLVHLVAGVAGCTFVLTVQ